jgi:Trypsin-like peptidase domain
MFVKAVEHASKFTSPVVISSRTVGGKVTSGCGSFVIVNDEGWILTAAHIFSADRVLAEHQKAHTEYLEKRREIEGRNGLNINKKRKLVSRLNFSEDWLSGVSFWWGQDGLSCKQLHMNPLADIAITKLENFRAAPDATFPKFGNPSVELSPGRSLCRTGFPFHSIESSYDEGTNTFRFAPGSLPIPRFPLDGILTRYRIVQNAANNATRAKFLEISTPGLRGQSGGPVFDTDGVVWGIQTGTNHLPLGFQPEVTDHGRKVAEHQFLNVGLAAYVSEIIALLKQYNVKHDMAM